MPAPGASLTRSRPPAGAYPYGAAGKAADWDAHAWTGVVHDDAGASGLPPRHRQWFGWSTRLWFWLLVTGLALSVLPAILASRRNSPEFAAGWGLIGFPLLMAAGVLLISGQVRARRLPHLWQVVLVGLGSGLFASVVAPMIEGREKLSIGLWFSGPVEETLKLLVPLALLIFGGVRFKDPRAGLLMVMISGAVFGATELLGYVEEAGGYGILSTVIGRSIGEWFHIYLTGFAAAVIWLAAWRARRAFTVPGLVAWAMAVAVHSLNDGSYVILHRTSRADLHPDYATWALAWPSFWHGMLLSSVTVAMLYLLCRYSARELVPPDAVAGNAPGWRPRIRRWGLSPDTAGAHSTQSPSSPPA